MMTAKRCAALSLGVLCLAACVTEPDAPNLGPPGLRVVSGAPQSDTVGSLLAIPVVVEVRDSSGRPAAGVRVRFMGQQTAGTQRTQVGPDDGTGPIFDTTTNARGRAQAMVRLGPVAGATYIRASVLPLVGAADSARATFVVSAGQPAQVHLPIRDSTAYVGNGYDLRATVADRYANPRLEPVTYRALGPSVATVDESGRIAALQLGRAGFRVTGSGFADTAWITVPPVGMLAAWDVGGGGVPPGLVLIRLDGSGYRRIADPGRFPEWIAAGDFVLYERSNRVHVVDTLGATNRVLLPNGPSTGETRASVSADGQWLFFNDIIGCGPLYRARPDGSQASWIGPTACDSMVTWASSSPDGLRAAVWHTRGIGIFDVATRAIEIIVPDCLCLVTNWPARWSPDGTTLAFVKDTVLHLTTPAGAVPVQLTAPHSASYETVEFDWSPDSQWLVARRRSGLDVIRVADGLRLPLNGWSGRLREPAWRP